jgi:hypothetical protein
MTYMKTLPLQEETLKLDGRLGYAPGLGLRLRKEVGKHFSFATGIDYLPMRGRVSFHEPFLTREGLPSSKPKALVYRLETGSVPFMMGFSQKIKSDASLRIYLETGVSVDFYAPIRASLRESHGQEVLESWYWTTASQNFSWNVSLGIAGYGLQRNAWKLSLNWRKGNYQMVEGLLEHFRPAITRNLAGSYSLHYKGDYVGLAFEYLWIANEVK